MVIIDVYQTAQVASDFDDSNYCLGNIDWDNIPDRLVETIQEALDFIGV